MHAHIDEACGFPLPADTRWTTYYTQYELSTHGPLAKMRNSKHAIVHRPAYRHIAYVHRYTIHV